MGIMYRRYVIIRDGAKWRIWDHVAEHWCGKFGEIDNDYHAASREVAAMRIRDWRRF